MAEGDGQDQMVKEILEQIRVENIPLSCYALSIVKYVCNLVIGGSGGRGWRLCFSNCSVAEYFGTVIFILVVSIGGLCCGMATCLPAVIFALHIAAVATYRALKCDFSMCRRMWCSCCGWKDDEIEVV